MLIVEDGTGLSDANSYASIAQADAFYELRGNMEWMFIGEEKKQQLLVQATDYIDIRFKYTGAKKQQEQALQFPRNTVGLPNNVVKACIEYAWRANDKVLAPDIESHASGLQIVGTSEKVGPLEESVTFAGTSSADNVQKFKLYPQTDSLLEPYSKSAMSSGRVIR